MANDNVLSELIYEYYESRILFGMYQYGDQLRSISQIWSGAKYGADCFGQIGGSWVHKNRTAEDGHNRVPGDRENLHRKCYEVFCSAQRWNARY